MKLALLAAEGVAHKGLWYPTVIGVLAVAAGVLLFCGSIYALLGTNLGARLGFLVAFTGLMGWMLILTILWMTTASPLNTLRGSLPQWKVHQVVKDLSKAKDPEARDITRKGTKATTEQAADVKAAVDGALVTKIATAVQPLEPGVNKFAEFADTTKYQVVKTYEIGGSHPNFFDWELTHKPRFAVAEFCPIVTSDDLHEQFGLPPPKPQCFPGKAHKFIIFERDLGSVRLPPVVTFFAVLILFGLGLLGLHWREQDEAAVAAAAATPDRPGRAIEPAPAGA